MEEEDENEDQFVDDDEYEPSEQEITEYCEWLGMDPDSDKVLTWIAREALKAPLPENWKICYTEDREVYYFNVRTGESIWDHPMDAYYKALFRQEKVKLEKKRRKMRLFSGSFPILPLQDFYSELTEEEPREDGFAVEIPDHLIDPIDLRLFIDPVVLPTSGRTVSKHTIVNNKWRDPFSREYIENRRLIPNVDKRNEVATWLDATTARHFEAIVATSSIQPLLRMLPYVLDKECEVSLKVQNMTLKYVRKLFDTPAPAPCKECPSPPAGPAQGAFGTVRRNGRRINKGTPRKAPASSGSSSSAGSLSSAVSGGSTAPRPPPQAPPTDSNASNSRGYYELMQLTDEEANGLIGCLLTMSTTASIETLYLILDAVPQFRCVPVFRNFSPEVLNALHLSPLDLQQIYTAAVADCPPPAWHMSGGESLPGHASFDTTSDSMGMLSHRRAYHLSISTSNSEHITQLRWVVVLMDYPNHLNILEKLDWHLALHLIVLTVNSSPDVLKTRTTLVCRLLRGLEGWPGRLKDCPAEVIQWLIDLTLMDTNPWNQILLIYDLLVNGGEAAAENIKLQKSVIVESLFAATISDSGQGITYASMLGALLVFQDCFKLSDFGHNKTLEMSIASDLLPRLTRQQWKPKHFEQTIQGMIASIKRDPERAWQTMGSKATAFLVKELSKKKKNCEDLQARLELIEASERSLQAAHGTANWALLYLKLHHQKRLPRLDGDPAKQELVLGLIDQHESQKLSLERERVTNLVVALQTLLSVRLKPKQPRDRDSLKASDCLVAAVPDRPTRPDTRLGGGSAAGAQVPGSSFPRGRRREKPAKDTAFDGEPLTPPNCAEPTACLSSSRIAPRSLEQSGSKPCMLPPIL